MPDPTPLLPDPVRLAAVANLALNLQRDLERLEQKFNEQNLRLDILADRIKLLIANANNLLRRFDDHLDTAEPDESRDLPASIVRSNER